MDKQMIVTAIAEGKTALGIELGSTRIKAVLVGPDLTPLVSGSYSWENRLVDGYWSYSMDDAIKGLQAAYGQLRDAVQERYGIALRTVCSLGISAMMHGYLPFDKHGIQLAPFRTWRNTNTQKAADHLTKLFGFNIPLRWSGAHLYQAILDQEEHVKDIDFLTTLSGYIHWRLTGRHVLGINDASGMFPIDSQHCDYHGQMAGQYNALLKDHGLPYALEDIFPKVLAAGEAAGNLTPEGAALLDPSGALEAGIPLCPPEGDAGTGMVATNSVAVRTGNVSAGTSIFAMVVLEKMLSRVYTQIDMVTTPAGDPVAMVHCNTCTSDVDAWVRLLGEMATAAGAPLSDNELYALLYNLALQGDPDCGGLVNFNFFAGEPIVDIDGGRPLLVRRPDSKLTLANLMRTQLLSAMAVLKIGMKILEDENVHLDVLLGHGGFFKVPGVNQKLMAGALNVPVCVMETASEGGPWGMALLAAYMVNRSENQPLADYLSQHAFANAAAKRIEPDPVDIKGFTAFMKNYVAALPVEKAAVEQLQ